MVGCRQAALGTEARDSHCSKKDGICGKALATGKVAKDFVSLSHTALKVAVEPRSHRRAKQII